MALPRRAHRDLRPQISTTTQCSISWESPGSTLGLGRGKGDGTFHPWSLVGRNYLSTTPFVYGDFNGDGNLDVALDAGPVGANQVTRMSIMLGNGNGKFTAGPTITAYGGLGDVVAGDFNQDGKLDLMTRGQQSVSEVLGNGDGSFQHVTNLPYNSMAGQMVVGDSNGDSKVDLYFRGGKRSRYDSLVCARATATAPSNHTDFPTLVTSP